MKHMGSARKNIKSNGSSADPKAAALRFVLCVENKGYAASLEPRKVYRLIADVQASRHGQLRVVDESGEDYLYPKTFFAGIKVSPDLAKALASGT